jgi:hypothetical protein
MATRCALTLVRGLGFTLLLAAGGASSGFAQTAGPGAHAWELRPHAARALWVPARESRRPATGHEPLGGLLGSGDRDYRYTGFFVGAGAGLATVAVAVAWCSDAEGGCDYGRVALFAPLGVAAVGLAGCGSHSGRSARGRAALGRGWPASRPGLPNGGRA